MRNDGNWHVDPLDKTVDPKALARSETAFLRVTGMRCQVCAMRVRNSLLSRSGVRHVLIDLSAGLVLVHYNAEEIEPQTLVEAVARVSRDGRHVYRASVLG